MNLTRACRLPAILLLTCASLIEAPFLSSEAAAASPDLLDRLEQSSRAQWLPAADEVVAMRREGARLLRERRWSVPNALIGARWDSLIAEIACLHADLSLEPRTLRVGQELFYNVDIRNESEEKLVFMGPIDGAEDGVRSPRIGLEITDDAGAPVDAGARWCRAGEVERFRSSDLRTVGAGESVSYFDSPHRARENGHWYWSPTRPGLYRVRFIYDASATEWEAWRGRGDEPSRAAEQLWRTIHHQRVISDWVTIHVID